MAWRRYWLSENCFKGDRVEIRGGEFHHIFGVCRMKVNDSFEVIHPHGKAYLVKVNHLDKKTAEAQIVELREISALPFPRIHLVVALSRFQTMDSLIEKAVEMGVFVFHPVVSEFSHFRKTSDVDAHRMERWKKIIRSATQQTGRGDFMEVAPVTHLSAALDQCQIQKAKVNAAGLFFYEGDAGAELRNVLKKLSVHLPSALWIFVGSEGGFSASEVQKFRDADYPPVSLGPQVLRVETACVAALGAIKYEFGLMA